MSMDSKARDLFLAYAEALGKMVSGVKTDDKPLTAEQQDTLWYSKEASQIRSLSKQNI